MGFPRFASLEAIFPFKADTVNARVSILGTLWPTAVSQRVSYGTENRDSENKGLSVAKLCRKKSRMKKPWSFLTRAFVRLRPDRKSVRMAKFALPFSREAMPPCLAAIARGCRPYAFSPLSGEIARRPCHRALCGVSGVFKSLVKVHSLSRLKCRFP